MPKKRFNPTVNYTSPDGYPSEIPPQDGNGEVDLPESEYDPEDEEFFNKFDHE